LNRLVKRQIDRPPSLTDVVLERLRADIVKGDLRLGQLLSERVLAEKLGISKTPVREALAQLRLEGLVRIVPQRGAFVFSLSASEVTAMCEYRLVLEAAALRMTMVREPKALARDITRIVSTMVRVRKAGDREAYLKADTAFHAAFFEHCGNSYFSEAYARHVGKIAALRTHLAMKPLHTEKSFAEHQEMAELLRRGGLEEALLVLDTHIGRTKTTYAAGIEDIAAADAPA
jgi:DNA-binding GntR family transcriptional regulator